MPNRRDPMGLYDDEDSGYRPSHSRPSGTHWVQTHGVVFSPTAPPVAAPPQTSREGVLTTIVSHVLAKQDVGGWSGSWPIGTIGPFGVVTAGWSVNGSVETCSSEGKTGLLLVGSVSVSLSATIGLDTSGTQYRTNPSGGGVQVQQNFKPRSGKNSTTSGQPKRRDISHAQAGYGVKKSEPETASKTCALPKCETDLDLTFALKLNGTLTTGISATVATLNIGECSVQKGCHWQLDWESETKWKVTVPGASMSLSGSGSAKGKVFLGGS